MLNHVLNQQSGEASEGKTVDTGSETFFHGADGTLDLADVTVGRDNISDYRKKVVSDAVEFVITMEGGDGETAASVCLQDWLKGIEDGVAVGHKRGGAITDVARDGVKKRNALYVEKIGA